MQVTGHSRRVDAVAKAARKAALKRAPTAALFQDSQQASTDAELLTFCAIGTGPRGLPRGHGGGVASTPLSEWSEDASQKWRRGGRARHE